MVTEAINPYGEISPSDEGMMRIPDQDQETETLPDLESAGARWISQRRKAIDGRLGEMAMQYKEAFKSIASDSRDFHRLMMQEAVNFMPVAMQIMNSGSIGDGDEIVGLAFAPILKQVNLLSAKMIDKFTIHTGLGFIDKHIERQKEVWLPPKVN